MTADPVTADVAAPHRALAAADSARGGLPRGWAWTTLGGVIVPNRDVYKPADAPHLPFVGMEHVEAETMRLLGLVSAGEMKSNALHFWPGDVMYGRLRPYLNKVLRPEFEGLCSAEFIVFRETPHLDNGYLQYFLNSWAFRDFASHLNEGDRPRVDWDQLKVYPFPLPPLAEQPRIVAAIEQQFTRLDAGVAALRRAQTALKRYRAAVLKAAVEGRLTDDWRRAHPDAEPAKAARERLYAARDFELRVVRSSRHLWGAGHVAAVSDAQRDSLPLTWDMCKVRDLGPDPTSVVQVGPMSMKSSEFSDTGVPVLNVGCVKWGHLDLSKLNHLPQEFACKFDRYRIRAGDVVFTRSGSVGRCAVAGPEQDGWLMTFHLLRARADTRVCLPTYLTFVFEGAPHIQKQIGAAAIGSTRAGFNTRLLEELDVPLPPLAEQQAIVAEVERRLSVVAALEAAVAANLARAERLRQAILREAFAGRLVPQDPDDEPASALLERIRREREEATSGNQRQEHAKPDVPVAVPTSLWGDAEHNR